MKDFDQRGVVVEMKNVMAIESASIIIGDEVAVDEAMDMVSVAVGDVVIVIDMSMSGSRCWSLVSPQMELSERVCIVGGSDSCQLCQTTAKEW